MPSRGKLEQAASDGRCGKIADITDLFVAVNQGEHWRD